MANHELACVSVSKYLNVIGADQETKAALVLGPQHQHHVQFRGVA